MATLLTLATSCKSTGNSDSRQETVAVSHPTTPTLGPFNTDSAYQYVADQVAFGPRVPGTESHQASIPCSASLLTLSSCKKAR